jgi:hypothetical protein
MTCVTFCQSSAEGYELFGCYSGKDNKELCGFQQPLKRAPVWRGDPRKELPVPQCRGHGHNLEEGMGQLMQALEEKLDGLALQQYPLKAQACRKNGAGRRLKASVTPTCRKSSRKGGKEDARECRRGSKEAAKHLPPT